MANAATTHIHNVSLDQLDELNKHAAQLSALLATISGGGFQAFKECVEEVQDNTLWLASDLANKIRDGLLPLASGSES
ncbi:hypothetical protein [Ralstonia wenshanensis]|uniref:Uncharacterized protein n=1 Tax=Ralstonia wenshanensis TaxID=2842456 RepID=A0AAD2EQU1_9RALS|nr:hypothetical protein [Ralstonia wenshanensis]CAJ0699220.1 hypothetical protein LMG18091_02879 [Ralstonia wenshanensis]